MSNGYNMEVVYTSDPNSTVSERLWFDGLKGASYFASKVKPTCQPQALAVNTVFSTNQTGLTHTIKSIYQTNGSTSAIASSLIYLNNVFENCTINYIILNLEAEDRTVNQCAVSQWGADLTVS